MVIFQRILIEFRRAVKRKKAITVVVFGIVVGAVVDATVAVSDVTTVVAVAAVVVVIVIGNVVVVVAATVDVHLSAINFLKYFKIVFVTRRFIRNAFGKRHFDVVGRRRRR